MRWVFLLLMMLNAFYYVWHLQQAPLRAKEVVPFSSQKRESRDIRLLNEPSSGLPSNNADGPSGTCLALGGAITQKDARAIEQRLMSLDIDSVVGRRLDGPEAGYWVKVAPESRRLIDDALLAGLRQDFPPLKSEIMSCAGIATSKDFE